MLFKKQMIKLFLVVFVAMTIAGYATIGAENTVEMESYSRDILNKTELNECLIKISGMQSVLDEVDRGILNGAEPITEEMTFVVDQNVEKIKSEYKDNFKSTLKVNGFESEKDYKNALLLESQRTKYVYKYMLQHFSLNMKSSHAMMLFNLRSRWLSLDPSMKQSVNNAEAYQREIVRHFAEEKLVADPRLASKAFVKLRADNGTDI